jgi:hypothetical protein
MDISGCCEHGSAMRTKSLTREVDAIEERWICKRVDYRQGKIEFRQCTGLLHLRYGSER